MALPTRVGRLHLPVLCFVVSKADAKDGDVEKLVTDALAGGATMIQLRDHETPAGELVTLARRLKTITRGKALLIVNDRVDVAQMMEADGVQLPQEGLPVRSTRALLGRYPVIGRSVHDVDGARQAATEGAEFVIAGTIYKSTSHPDAQPARPGLIGEITKNSSLPVLAIGGITAANVDEVIKAGAVGVAVISAVAGAEDPKAATEELSKALKEAWTSLGALGASA
jgi:thiamine-phosphate pyrophosphorylase